MRDTEEIDVLQDDAPRGNGIHVAHEAYFGGDPYTVRSKLAYFEFEQSVALAIFSIDLVFPTDLELIRFVYPQEVDPRLSLLGKLGIGFGTWGKVQLDAIGAPDGYVLKIFD